MKTRKLRRGLVAASALLLTAGLAACGSGDTSGTADTPGDASKTIAISFPNSSAAPVVQNLFRIAEAKADELGYTLVLDDPGNDQAKQVNTIKTWIQQGVAAIVSSTLDPEVVNGVAKEARDAGVKWVTFADSIENQDATLGFPHKEAGEELGKAAAEWINANLGGEAEVGILALSTASYARERADGIEEQLAALAPNAKIVATQDAVDASLGLEKTSAMLQANPGLDVVLAVEDAAGQGAYQAFLNAGHDKDDPKIFIGGIDGAEEQLKMVEEGTMFRATAAFDQQALGEGFVTLPDALLHGSAEDYYTPVKLVMQGDPAITQLLAAFGS